jgi:mono/diheme cytochrome c family protein
MKRTHAIIAATLLALALPAGVPGPAAGQAGGDAKAQAQDIFKNRCTPCHGAAGKGDGAASAGLTPKPRDFSDPAWQKSVTDDHIEKIIKFGGAAVGKSPAMPANPDLMSKPQVVTELKNVVRGLGGK